jgi:TonB family protein
VTDGASAREWISSLAGHLVVCALLAWGIFFHPIRRAEDHLSVIIENPQLGSVHAAVQALPHSRPHVLKRAPEIALPRKEEITDSASVPIPSQAAKSDAEAAASDGGLPSPVAEFTVTEMPQLASEVRIPYPSEARRRSAQGAVVMDLLIDDVGQVRKVTLVQGADPDLSKAAVEAIKDFRFKPARVNEKKVAVLIRYTYRFVLDN